MTLRLDLGSADFEARFTDFLGAKRETEADVNDVVVEVLEAVRARGDAALAEFTQKFDRFNLAAAGLRFSADEIARARTECAPDTLSALDVAAERIRTFHEKQLPDDLDYTDDAGLRLGYRWTPVGAAGLYVPGGTAAYPSSVLMNAMPAKVAGVGRLVMVVPTPDGVINPLVLAAADLAGVDEIYRIGGAQAVGALAYGTETIRSVDKIVGPGNAYVAAAKRQVFGTVGIDMIAGPSEILVLADRDNDPTWIAADLLSQAEHDTAAQSILITDDAAFADAVVDAVDGHLKTLPRTKTAGASWRTYGAVITVPDLPAGLPLVDRIAPEHLEIASDDARILAEQVNNAGAIFIGRYVPEALGDYLAGPNHVLPTARSARFSSGLGVLDFMKRTSMIECSAEGLRNVGPAAVTLARAEGLDAHALSIAIRLNLSEDQ
ncbi:MAG: histidinol dehydrogenase [Rhodospirillaceae bacterium]|nr:histidinol dehydrogenase [Rhodospirillaceae bacterium]